MKMLGLILATLVVFGPQGSAPQRPAPEQTPGELRIVGKDGKAAGICPLEKTTVNADVSGFGARVTVVQNFTNPTTTPIEAVYTFPMPNDAAVDRMRMQVGSRIIEGTIKRREEARTIYEAAKAQGQSAALLDQERPNIFTQSVANIMPGAKVQIEISYVQLLKYEEGQFEFSFPMVVGPRFLGNAQDPGKIAPPITPQGTRTGANIELTVNLNAGAPIQEIGSVLHAVNVKRDGDSAATVTLTRRDEIPNRDFILRYRTATNTVQSAFIPHQSDERGGFFTLILMPPKAPTAQQISPKEMIFVMDQSGSQSGFPIQKSKELTLKLIKTLRPHDTFNVIGFNNTVRSLWPQAQPNTAENILAAEKFVKVMEANGGTQLREGVVAALEGQNDPKRLRIVVFNTDGYVGDENLILDTVQKRRDSARMFTFGIGNGVNRFLIDAMSAEGKGDAEYVTLAEAADLAVDRFIRRTRSPILTDVSVRIDGVPVTDMLPSAIPDVFDEKPVIVYGRYSGSGKGTVTLSGKLGGQPWSNTMTLNFPAVAKASAIPTLWARNEVDELTRKDWTGQMRGERAKPLSDRIIDVALDFGIMTQYTSFVAVEPRVVNIGGKQRTIRVPVEMADGVSYEGVLGDKGVVNMGNLPGSFARSGNPVGGGRGGRVGGAGGPGGFGGGFGSGSLAGGQGLVIDQSLGLKLDVREMANLTPGEKRKYLFDHKVDKQLRTATGTVEIQLWLNQIDDATLEKLAKAGVHIDMKDAKLKILFGTCSAAVLADLAQLDEVERIKPLES